jgi:N-acetylglucosamine-6-phosphate deacetylase
MNENKGTDVPVSPLYLWGFEAITPYRQEPAAAMVIQDGKIVQFGPHEDVTPPASAVRVDLTGRYVMPGFIDIHVHGGCGEDFSTADAEGLVRIEQFYASRGTTSLLATVYPQPPQPFFETLDRLVAACRAERPGRILEGIHLEGPFMNPSMHGAIPAGYMWEASLGAWREIYDRAESCIKVMTISPEIPGALEVARDAAMHGIHLEIGHSDASYEQVSEAIDNGLEGVTHIFNAMRPMHHRRPGVLVGTLLRDELFVEVIADAVHVHPAVLQLLLKIKTHDKIILVTDAIRAAGMPDGLYEFSGQPVRVSGGHAYLERQGVPSGQAGTLAGSTLTMDQALRTMVQATGASLAQAAQMASLNAARVLRMKHCRGILAVGKDADVVVMDKGLRVQITIKGGQVLYCDPASCIDLDLKQYNERQELGSRS